ncbi:hypothetical protein [Halomicrobium salinisoli]|uniref:hypothetical protein n=1 Tax=Halomicrobium salinisoli TaxID=2878391 RepID=UPI001CF0A056|nr:hypothetical protein [Halomicrobium salinisoli]
MSENESGSRFPPGRAVPARALKPRFVLGLLVMASFGGVWVARFGAPIATRAATWLVAAAAGALAGGLYWRLALFDGAAFDDAADARRVSARWRRVETVAVAAFAVAGVAYLATNRASPAVGTGAIGVGLVAAPLLWLGLRRSPPGRKRERQSTLRTALFAAALVALAGFAWLETGTTLADWLVRLVHVGAFALWIGGAVWHNFVVLPTARARPDAAATLKSQAESFRRHVPVLVALLLATGVYQTAGLVGFSLSALAASPVAPFVGLKALVLVLLTGLVAASVVRGP